VSGVDDTFDGTWVIASTPSATTFTFAVTAANVTSTAATGTAEIGDSKQYADAELRLFTAAQVAAAGFSVDVTTPLWSATDHSAPRSADASLGCAVDLENGGVYRVYARTTVADHVYAGGASTITTDWVYRLFTMVIAPAGPAAADAVWDDSTQSVDLVVTTRGNLVPTAFGSAESVLGAWAVSGCTVGRVADSGPAGSYVTEVTASGGGPATITMGAAYGLGVIAGERYLARVPVRAVSETRAVQVTLTWYDDGATVLGSVSSAAVSPAVADGWSQYLAVNGVAPAGATRVALAITVSGPPTAAAKWRVDAVSIVLAHGAADTGAGLVYGQGGTGAGLSDFRTLVERSVDGGDTWVQVRAPEGTDQTSLGIWGQRWTGVAGVYELWGREGVIGSLGRVVEILRGKVEAGALLVREWSPLECKLLLEGYGWRAAVEEAQAREEAQEQEAQAQEAARAAATTGEAAVGDGQDGGPRLLGERCAVAVRAQGVDVAASAAATLAALESDIIQQRQLQDMRARRAAFLRVRCLELWERMEEAPSYEIMRDLDALEVACADLERRALRAGKLEADLVQLYFLKENNVNKQASQTHKEKP